MPKRNWRPIIATAGWVIAAFAALCAASVFQHYAERGLKSCRDHRAQPHYAAQDKAHPYQTLPDGRISAPRPFQTPYKRLNCEWPQSKDDYENCQQWRAAEYAAEQACIAGLQFWVRGVIGVFGLLGLLGTVLYTGMAAQAASESADVAKKALTTTQRAYLSVEPLGIKQRKADEPWFATIGVRNAGHLPARNMRWFIRVQPFILDKEWAEFDYEQVRSGNHVVPPGSVLRFGSPIFSVDIRLKAERWLYVWGEITYFDGIDSEELKFTKFCHRYNSLAMVHDSGGGHSIPAEEGRHHTDGNDAT